MTDEIIKSLTSGEDSEDEDIIQSTTNRSQANRGIVDAVHRIPTEEISKTAGAGTVEFLKDLCAGTMQDRDALREANSNLTNKLAQTETERDVARSKLKDLRDINILHTILLGTGTALLGFYASYDSAGDGRSYSILLYAGGASLSMWFGFLIYRIVKK